MKKTSFCLFIFFLSLIILPINASAQSLLFELPSVEADYFINPDGTASVIYVFRFNNSPFGAVIDYIDVGLPNPNFVDSSISAQINGIPVTSISRSDFQGKGNAGVALYLGSNAIQPGDSGEVIMFVETINRILFPDSEDEEYTSTNFETNYFGSQFVQGQTDLTVRFHFPEGVQPEEPRWHKPPSGFPEEPESYLDEQGRIVYEWRNLEARPDQPYEFGASLPDTYVPSTSISKPTVSESVEDTFGIEASAISSFLMCCGGLGFIVFIIIASFRSTQNRKLQYLPPKIAIEGHGIKRGLTAVEAAILLEQPMDKILTMILFSVVKKNATTVKNQSPLELEISQPIPNTLRPYEEKFLEAFKTNNKAERRKILQDMMTELVKGVASSMKGFSRKETIEYYRDITHRAWAQVTAADTPEVKMEKFSDNIEWTMLDRNYDDRTRDVFRTGPVIIPTWWHRYDPTFSPGSKVAPSIPSSKPSPGAGGGITMPTLPGATFAASMVQGVQNFSKNVVGNISDFTGGITDRTNPIPPPTKTSSGTWKSGGGRSGGSSCACACACACAGCACACAGGGR